MATLTAIVLVGSSAWAQAANYYISASGALGSGSGSSAANAADASTPDKYYAINQAQSAPGTVIVYAPGIYLMQTGHTMFNGVTHQGAGIDSTIIKIADGTVSGWQPMWYAGGTLSGFKCLDATIDLNANNQPFWSGSGMSMAFAFPTADHCTIQRVKFIHMGAKGMESFPIYFIHGGSSNGNCNNNLVDSCIFTQPIASGNTKGGLTCIYMADSEPGITVDNTNVVSNCQFLDLNYPLHSDLTYAQCVTCPVAINNFARGVDAFWFIEPGSQSSGNNVFFTGQTVQVTGNTLLDSGPVARIYTHPNGTFTGNLNVQNNSVGMSQNPYLLFGRRPPEGVVIEANQTGNSSIGAVTVQNNTFTAPLPRQLSPSAVVIDPSRTNLFHLSSLTVINNTLINFPQDGNEFLVSANRSFVPNYTLTGNTFASAASSPYNGTPTPVPGNVYASNYDLGGQGAGYLDRIGANSGVYRTDGVDIKSSSDILQGGTRYVLGWRTAGEWTKYTVTVAQSDQYVVTARVESTFNTGKFHVNVDGTSLIPSITVPLTGPWDTASSWITLNLGTVSLTAGIHVITVSVDSQWFDLNCLTFQTGH
jgi:hypothetical protein